MKIRKKHQLGDYYLIQYQLLGDNIIRIVRKTVRRISNEITGVKGLNYIDDLSRYTVHKSQFRWNERLKGDVVSM